jgi:glycosyltransferase involved in cell wall biosynthesis
MRRVVIASRLYAPEVGAAAFRLRALANGLVREGAAVTVVTTTPPRGTSRSPHDRGIRVSRFPVLRDAGGNVRGYVQYLSFDIPLFFRLLFTHADLVVSEPPPTTGLVVAVTSWLRRRPYAYYAADVWTDGLVALGAPRPLIGIMRVVEGFVLRHASAVVAVSDEVADKVVSFGTSRVAVGVVGNGVDTDTFTPDGPNSERTRPTFVYTGAMSEWQSPSVFVEALPLVREVFPDASIRFFGQGVEEPHLRETARNLGLDSVHFGGVIPPAETATWIRGATAALASISPGAGYDFAKPTKTYAAAACGVPVVFAGEGVGAALVADNDLGWRCGHDPRSVADAMIAAATAQADGTTAAQRDRRASWARENASIAAAGTRAAEAILAVVSPAASAR